MSLDESDDPLLQFTPWLVSGQSTPIFAGLSVNSLYGNLCPAEMG
jgi:hypothetical protein